MWLSINNNSKYLINLLYHRTTSYRVITEIAVNTIYVKSQLKIYLNNLKFFAGMYFPVIDSQYQREEDKNHVLAYNKWMYF